MRGALLRAAALSLLPLAAAPLAAQERLVVEGPDWEAVIEPLSGFTGQMSMTMEVEAPEDMAVTEVIRFEPWQMLDELFRDDIVLVMRAGPSDWDAADDPDAAPGDCDARRPLSAEGEDLMRQLGALLIVNGLRPGHVAVSNGCRAQATYLALERGMLQTDMDVLDGMTADMDARLSPLDAAGGPSAEALRAAIGEWDGGDGTGPLLMITHFPNVAEALRFNLYEGEMLIVDPKRDGRVLGYLRLASATPDPLRFPPHVVTATAAE